LPEENLPGPITPAYFVPPSAMKKRHTIPTQGGPEVKAIDWTEAGGEGR